MGIDAEDKFWVKCHSCGKEYSLLLATVCPGCWAWPKRDGSDRMFPKIARAEGAKNA